MSMRHHDLLSDVAYNVLKPDIVTPHEHWKSRAGRP